MRPSRGRGRRRLRSLRVGRRGVALRGRRRAAASRRPPATASASARHRAACPCSGSDAAPSRCARGRLRRRGGTRARGRRAASPGRSGAGSRSAPPVGFGVGRGVAVGRAVGLTVGAAVGVAVATIRSSSRGGFASATGAGCGGSAVGGSGFGSGAGLAGARGPSRARRAARAAAPAFGGGSCFATWRLGGRLAAQVELGQTRRHVPAELAVVDHLDRVGLDGRGGPHAELADEHGHAEQQQVCRERDRDHRRQATIEAPLGEDRWGAFQADFTPAPAETPRPAEGRSPCRRGGCPPA